MAAQGTPYRPDIDGLRAISILLVVAYHAHPWLIPGGFIGVDIFFVISGYLITRILSRGMESGGFSITNFYGRRIRRIFPALIVVLVTTYAMGWFILLPDQMQLLGKNVVAGVAFAANLFQISQAGYFAPDVAENPLLHLWSLGVEEQFYIFWPPALLLIAGSKRRLPWFGIIAAVSFCVSLIDLYGHKDWAFYSPVARAWELLAGGMLAATRLSSRRFAIPENLASLSGLLAIFGSALALDNGSPFPGPYALFPVIGAVLIIASPNALLNRYVLSSRVFVWFGLISYPLYLWHWPLLSYLAILRNGVPNFLEIWAAVAIAVILSALTYQFIEIPLRKRPEVVPKLSAGLAAIGVMGIAAIVTSGFAFRFPPVVQDIARIRVEDNPSFADHCFLETARGAFDASCIEQGDRPLLFLWGDSTAAALYPALKDAEDRLGSFRLARFTLAGCAPILEVGSNTRCDGDNRKVFDFVRSARPDVVLLHAMWGTTTNLEKLAATIRELRASKVPRIVMLGPVPVWKRTLPHALINHYRFSHELPERISAGMWGPEGDRMMEAFSRGAGIEYISARQVFCDEMGCLTRVGPSASDVVTTDIVHLSERGARFLVAAIGRTLLPEPHGQLSNERNAPPAEEGRQRPN
jgi:peptidoglycan/LPS O-acetylase OafA/YrhL